MGSIAHVVRLRATGLVAGPLRAGAAAHRGVLATALVGVASLVHAQPAQDAGVAPAAGMEATDTSVVEPSVPAPTAPPTTEAASTPHNSANGPSPATSPSTASAEATTGTVETAETTETAQKAPPQRASDDPAVPSPTPVEEFYRRGNAALNGGRFEEAVDVYVQGLKAHPDDARLHAMLGFSRARAGDVTGSIDPLKRATELDSKNSNFHFALGRGYERVGADTAALAAYANALLVAPTNDAARQALYRVRRRMDAEQYGQRRAHARSDGEPASLRVGGGLRVGYGLPLGQAAAGSSLNARVSGQLPLWLDLGLHLGPALFAGVYGEYAFGSVGSAAARACDATSDVTCSVSDIRLGLQLHLHGRPAAAVDPWLGLGAGYQWHTVSVVGSDPDTSVTMRGPEYVNLQAGIDLGAGSYLRWGPFVAGSLGQFRAVSRDCSGRFDCDALTSERGGIDHTALHGRLVLGVRGALAAPTAATSRTRAAQGAPERQPDRLETAATIHARPDNREVLSLADLQLVLSGSSRVSQQPTVRATTHSSPRRVRRCKDITFMSDNFSWQRHGTHRARLHGASVDETVIAAVDIEALEALSKATSPVIDLCGERHALPQPMQVQIAAFVDRFQSGRARKPGAVATGPGPTVPAVTTAAAAQAIPPLEPGAQPAAVVEPGPAAAEDAVASSAVAGAGDSTSAAPGHPSASQPEQPEQPEQTELTAESAQPGRVATPVAPATTVVAEVGTVMPLASVPRRAAAGAASTQPQPQGIGTAALVSFVAAGAGLATFAVAGTLAVANDGMLKECSPACGADDVSLVKDLALIADVGLAAAVVGAGLGLTLVLLEDDEHHSISLQPFTTTRAAGALMRGRF